MASPITAEAIPTTPASVYIYRHTYSHTGCQGDSGPAPGTTGTCGAWHTTQWACVGLDLSPWHTSILPRLIQLLSPRIPPTSFWDILLKELASSQTLHLWRWPAG